MSTWAASAMNIGSALMAVLGLAHCALNLRLLRTPASDPRTVTEHICVLVPARNEHDRIPGLLHSLREQQHLASWSIVVGDDGSTDGTAELARRLLAGMDNAIVATLTGGEPADGWLGKPWACHRLSQLADDATVLVFVDADVTLAPTALASAVQTMRSHNLSIVCPYPRQIASTGLQRLVQPLLQWSWATTLPLRIAERSRRPSLTAGNGQFLLIDRRAYAEAGGHSAVRGDVLEDIALVRAVKSTGGTGGVIDGTHIATCRMYERDSALIAGYTKSLWSAFGSEPAAVAVCFMLIATYVSPLLWLSAWAAGLVELTQLTVASALTAYLAGVLNRALVAHRVKGRVIDATAHPLSIACLCWLVCLSLARHRRGVLRWKDRVVA